WAQYSRGVLPGVQVSGHLAPMLLTLANLAVKVQVLDRPELRASVEGGAYWLGIGRLLNANAMAFPLAARGSVPLADDLELHLGAGYQRQVLSLEEVSFDRNVVHAETTLARYDGHGAFLLTAKLPLFSVQRVSTQGTLGSELLAGSLALDDVSSWSVMLARDHLFGRTGHVRFGLGYRHRPGVILLESLGNVLLTFDIYWR
ncbi:MAG TPA: hypothetical protein VLQ93_02455, partial [Myxococcaceae bacterium]|nr:hypothetical protein [Myxococcaceae bacterium]